MLFIQNRSLLVRNRLPVALVLHENAHEESIGFALNSFAHVDVPIAASQNGSVAVDPRLQIVEGHNIQGTMRLLGKGTCIIEAVRCRVRF